MEEADAKLKQFEVLWAEIARRSNAQQALIGVAATATGTVSGLVVGQKADPALFVVLVAVAPVFGLLWLDHALNIGEIASFIGENWQWGEPNWEKFYETQKQLPHERHVGAVKPERCDGLVDQLFERR